MFKKVLPLALLWIVVAGFRMVEADLQVGLPPGISNGDS